MKKILTFFSAITFIATSTLAVSACGISKGQEIQVNVPNAPKKAKNGQDPLIDYVYNNKYNYNNGTVNNLLAVAAQLTTDKIYNDNHKTFTSETWEKFYNSYEWQRGYFSSFNYDQKDVLPKDEHDFSFNDGDEHDFIYQINGDDASIDNNKLRMYWFVTSKEPWSKDHPEIYKPTKTNIKIPKLTDFTKDKKTIIKKGWLHLYLLIGKFRIDFSAEINFVFKKYVDKNHQPLVVLDFETFVKPFGPIDFNKSEESYKVIQNIVVSEVV